MARAAKGHRKAKGGKTRRRTLARNWDQEPEPLVDVVKDLEQHRDDGGHRADPGKPDPD